MTILSNIIKRFFHTKPLYLVRSLLFTIVFAISTIIISIIFSPFLIIKNRILYWVGIIWCKISLFLLRFICGIKYQVTGHKNLPDSPYIVASKHQSAFETILFWDIFYIPTFVLKKELTKLPFFGIYLVRMGMVYIDRASGTKALKQIISDANQHICDGRKVIIYPEGTRTDPGKITEKYNSGVVALYKNCNVPVVPVALNTGSFWPSKGWIKYPGLIQVNILPPINPGLDKEEFLKRLNNDIETRSFELYQDQSSNQT